MMIELYLIRTGVDGVMLLGQGFGGCINGGGGMKPLANRFNKVIYFDEVKFDVRTFFYLTSRQKCVSRRFKCRYIFSNDCKPLFKKEFEKIPQMSLTVTIIAMHHSLSQLKTYLFTPSLSLKAENISLENIVDFER